MLFLGRQCQNLVELQDTQLLSENFLEVWGKSPAIIVGIGYNGTEIAKGRHHGLVGTKGTKSTVLSL